MYLLPPLHPCLVDRFHSHRCIPHSVSRNDIDYFVQWGHHLWLEIKQGLFYSLRENAAKDAGKGTGLPVSLSVGKVLDLPYWFHGSYTLTRKSTRFSVRNNKVQKYQGTHKIGYKYSRKWVVCYSCFVRPTVQTSKLLYIY